MLDSETNATLTRVGRGTPMGELLRRYWMPIAGVSELRDNPVKPVRLMGEDLVLFRDLSGAYGLVERHCPHRRADLSYGFVEACGLRCNYHGWLFAADGRCAEQPYEDAAHPEAHFRDKVTIGAYPVQARGGMLWAYLGPLPAPWCPDYEAFHWPNGFVQVVISEVPCNWLQAQENSIDPVHFEWLHRNWSLRMGGKPGPYAPKHVRVDFEEVDAGIVYRRLTADTDETDPLWRIGRLCLWPNALFTGESFQWRIPVDDTNMLAINWQFSRVPKDFEPYVQDEIPTWYSPVSDPLTGRWLTEYVMNQDYVAWVGQGRVSDRENEHLGPGDRGITMLRRRFLADVKRIEAGEDPKAVVRDAPAAPVKLPLANERFVTEGLTFAEFQAHPSYPSLRNWLYHAGQPPHVKAAYEAAMGLTGAPQPAISVPEIMHARPTVEPAAR